jgi:predicted phosphodiesterase
VGDYPRRERVDPRSWQKLILTSGRFESRLKVAIISDIHGNLTALGAVLPAIKRFDRVICLGDIAAVGPQPRETIALLRKMKWPCVMGNTDESLANSILENYDRLDTPQEEKRRMMTLDRWTATQLGESDRRFLSGFERTITVKGRQASLLCYHGSPRSNREGILSTTPDDRVATILGNHSATIFAGGHTHVQMVRRLGGSIIMNPGSVGLPFEKDAAGKFRNPARAEYSIVTFNGQELSVELCRTAYDLAELEKAVRGSGMPNPDRWLADWF